MLSILHLAVDFTDSKRIQTLKDVLQALLSQDMGVAEPSSR